MDNSVLIPSQPTKKTSILNWVFVINFAVSITALILGSVAVLKKPPVVDLTTFPFSINKTEGLIQKGQVVSINSKGNLQAGEGTTITKNIMEWEGVQFPHLQSVTIHPDIFIYAYDGTLVATRINEKGEVEKKVDYPLPKVDSKTRMVDDLRVLDNNVVVVLGSNEVIPCEVEYDSTNIHIQCTKGVRFTEKLSVNAQMDTLDETSFAISYYFTEDVGKYKLATRVGFVDRTEYLHIYLYDETPYSSNYMFHGIAGLDDETYVLAKAGSEDGSSYDLMFQLARITNGKPQIGHELVLKNRTDIGFFDMDNVNDHQIIVTFVDGNTNNGLETILLLYDRDRHRLVIGPYLDNQDGGASGQADSGAYNFIHVRILSETRFGVFYSNVLDHGATAFCMGEIAPTNDLIAVGPEFILSAPMVDPSSQYYWLSESCLFNNRLVLIESLTSTTPEDAHAEMHLLDIKPLPLGVVTKVDQSTITVAVAGKMTFNTLTFEPGRNYYGDALGNIHKGEFVGSLNTESYYIYVETEDGKILSDDNRIGYAIDEHTLFLKVHNYTCFFFYTIFCQITHLQYEK